MRYVWLWLFFVMLGGSAAADCLSSVGIGALDSRTGTYKINYQRCHWENEFNPDVQQLWDNLCVSVVCATIATPVAADDDVPLPFITRTASEVKAVSCRGAGTCSTAPTIQIEDTNGDLISLASSLTCATGTTDATWVDVSGTDADRLLNAGQSARFDVTNTPTCDWLTVCVKIAATCE